MVGDRYRKRAKGRKRDFEREKHEWSEDDDDSELEEETFVSQRKMRKASKEEGGDKLKKNSSTCENPRPGQIKKKKLKRNIKNLKMKDQGISKQLKIEHDEAEQWFTLDLPNSGGQAFLQYSIEDDGKIDFWHTEVREYNSCICVNA